MMNLSWYLKFPARANRITSRIISIPYVLNYTETFLRAFRANTEHRVFANFQ